MLCICFVPVLFWAGLYASVEPVSALLIESLTGRGGAMSWGILIEGFIYSSAFTCISVLAYALVRLLPWRSARMRVLAVLLALPVASSFARI